MKNLTALAESCMNDLRGINIPIAEHIRWEINSRARHRWGQCTRIPGGYTIQITNRLLDDAVDDSATKQTIYHELLHTTPGGHGHTGMWKVYAGQVSRAFGIDITRCTSAEEKGITSEINRRNNKYQIDCDRCGHQFFYTKRSKIVQAIQAGAKTCKCPYCGSNSFTTITL